MNYSVQATCAFQVVLNHRDTRRISKKRDLFKKRKLIAYLKKLIADGYRTFVIYVGNQVDFWTAEVIWEFSITAGNPEITYMLVFITSVLKMENEWIDQESVWNEVTGNAQRILWQKDFYPMQGITLKMLDLSH